MMTAISTTQKIVPSHLHNLFYSLSVFIVGFLATFITGCETSVTDTKIVLPHNEELVLQSLMEAGKPVETILVMRTLPPLQIWSLAEAIVPDAMGTIRSGEQTWSLKYTDSGLYTVEGFIPEPGKSYQIEVQWKNLSVTATTTIPEPPVIDSIVVERRPGSCFFDPDVPDTATFVTAFPHPEPNVVYRAASYGRSNFDDALYLLQPSYDVYRGSEADSTGKLGIQTLERCYGPEPGNLDTILVHVIGYEPAFYDYYNTKDNGSDDGPFGGDPTAIKWNVSGDGFGFFFGYALARQQVILE